MAISLKIAPGILLFALLLLTACGGEVRSIQALPDYLPARADTPYAEALGRCPYEYNRNGNNNYPFCALERLPLLGQEHDQMSVDAIMDRTVVSHTWMANNFEALLNEFPDDLLQLFQGVTAVVIGTHIRPSYYWSATGAIYLDPADLWLTASQRSTISREPDYRSDFSSDLQFTSLARYVQGNNRAWSSYPLTGLPNSRTLNDIILPMASLLFHELAHANDNVTPSQAPFLNDYAHLPLWQAVAHLDITVSEQLDNDHPLESDLLYALAAVMYQGHTASSTLRAITGEEVGLAFEIDGASDDYAYSSRFEDTAMLFEEVMMYHHFGISRELAFTNAPGNDAWCDDYQIQWGVRQRIGEPLVKERAALVLRQLLDRTDVSEYLDALPAPIQLTQGQGWCQSLTAFSEGPPPPLLERSQGFMDGPLPTGDRRTHGADQPELLLRQSF